MDIRLVRICLQVYLYVPSDRLNGVARLSRFQRVGYMMLIPQSMRIPFQIHRDAMRSSWNNDTTWVGVAPAKHNLKLTCHLKEPAPVVTPCSQKKPNQLIEIATFAGQSLAAIVAARSVATKKYQEAADTSLSIGSAPVQMQFQMSILHLLLHEATADTAPILERSAAPYNRSIFK